MSLVHDISDNSFAEIIVIMWGIAILVQARIQRLKIQELDTRLRGYDDDLQIN